MATLSTNIWAFLREAHQTRREKATSQEEGQIRSGLRQGFKEQERVLLDRLDATVGSREQPIPVIELGSEWMPVVERTQSLMAEVIQGAATTAFMKGSKSLISDLGVDIALDLEHPRALRFLEQRGAALISNIDNSTRQEVQHIISKGVREGKNYGVVRQELRAKFAQFHTPQPQLHIRDRAELIAVQETGEAYEAGNLETAEELRDLGVVMEKSCLTAEDDRVDDLCSANERQGWIPLESQYQSGARRPPFHVACRCTQLVRRAA